MLMELEQNQWIQYNRLPDSFKKRYEIKNIFVRPFGLLKEDLEIDFYGLKRPPLTVEILQCCCRGENGKKLGWDFLLDLPVGKRIELFLVAVTNGGESELSIPLECSNKNCIEQIEMEISLQDIFHFQDQYGEDEHIKVEAGAQEFLLRRPTGKDQLEWLKRDFSDKKAMRRFMMKSLLIAKGKKSTGSEIILSEDMAALIDSAMKDFDPLIDFTVLAGCPHCETENHFSIDLEAFALRNLHQSQMSLFRDINDLANHYHWTEDEILSIPQWRRIHYLEMLEKRNLP